MSNKSKNFFVSLLTQKFFVNFFIQKVFSNNFKKHTTSSQIEDVSKAWTGPLPPDSLYLKPVRFYYIQNGQQKTRDVMKAPNSVSVVIFNKTKNTLVFVKQFRPAVFYSCVCETTPMGEIDLKKYSPKMGVTLELCAGIVDKKKSCADIAREEVLEECGYDVDVSRVEEVMTYRSGVGSQGAVQRMFYCEVTDADKVSDGGGIEDEIIDVVEFSIEEAKNLVKQGSVHNSPPGFMLGILWFLLNKAPKCNET